MITTSESHERVKFWSWGLRVFFGWIAGVMRVLCDNSWAPRYLLLTQQIRGVTRKKIRGDAVRGFTLIEFAIVLSLIGIIFNITAVWLYQLVTSAQFQYTFSHVQGQSRLALERLRYDLNRIRSSSSTDLIADPLSSAHITFIDIEGHRIEYTLVDHTLMRNEDSHPNQPLADSVSTFQVQLLNQDGVLLSAGQQAYYVQVLLTLTELTETANPSIQSQTLRTVIAPGWF